METLGYTAIAKQSFSDMSQKSLGEKQTSFFKSPVSSSQVWKGQVGKYRRKTLYCSYSIGIILHLPPTEKQLKLVAQY